MRMYVSGWILSIRRSLNIFCFFILILFSIHMYDDYSCGGLVSASERVYAVHMCRLCVCTLDRE